jgi:hypothetical protein
MPPDRRRLLAAACDELGLECEFYGSGGQVTYRPEDVMAESDVVVGRSRVVLEAMACGRAAYVFDAYGADGWMEPQSYAELEADGFLGRAGDAPTDPARLRDDLSAYRPEMGGANRDLVIAHHDAADHVRELVGLFRRLAGEQRPEPPQEAPMRQLALLAQRHWLAEAELFHLRNTAARLRDELRVAEEHVANAELTMRQALDALAEIKGSSRYRLAQALTRPLDRLRGRGKG